MAATTDVQLPSAAVRQSNFEQAVVYSLHLWPALALAVQSNWGGPDSADKRDWFAGAIVELFSEFSDAPQTKAVEDPDMEDVETVLLQVMIDEFEVNVDDDSATDVADNIVRARAECANGQFDGVNKLSQRFQNLKGNTVDQMFKKAEDADQDTDWESDDDDEEQDEEGDVDMSDAPAPAPAAARREKPTAEVDEDGFTKVMHKKR